MKDIYTKRFELHKKPFAYTVDSSFRGAVDPTPWCGSANHTSCKELNCQGPGCPVTSAYISPMMEPILMIVPLCRFAMLGTTALQTRRTEKELVSKTCLTASIDCSTRGPVKRESSLFSFCFKKIKTTWSGHPCIIHHYIDLSFLIYNIVENCLNVFVACHVQGKPLDRLVREICNAFYLSRACVNFTSLASKFLAPVFDSNKLEL